MTVADGWSEHVTAIRESGLTLSLPDGSVIGAVHARRFDDLRVGGALAGVDAVFLAVKSYDTERVLTWLLPLLGASVPIVSLQNGLNERRIAELAGDKRTVGAVVMFDGIILEPGHAMTRHPAAALTIGAWPSGSSDQVARLAAVLGAALPVVVSDDIRSDLWGKLIVNCMVNAPAAASGLDLQHLVLSEPGRRACAETAREAAAVASAAGAVLAPTWLHGVSPEELRGPRGIALLEAALLADFGESDMRPSMLTDVERRRATEIDALNGVVVAEARRLGIAVPWNEHFVDVISRIDQREAEPDERWLVP
ncbi:MAG: 2-dehydropantoate 2-reductase [Frankiales bacterium]|nr:2-dehydropantoate 2-reductase [Frankiales bacterium]